MVVLEKIKSFLKPDKAKIILTVPIVLYALNNFFVGHLWGHSYSPISFLLFAPLVLTGIFSLIFLLPYSYILSCFVLLLFNSIKTRKKVLILVIVIAILLAGMDEPVVNNTINRPDYSCSADADCVVTSISKGWCGDYRCVNEEWEYYDSMINSVFALSCRTPLTACSCVESRCITKDLYKSTNLEDCEGFEEHEKEECNRVVSQNAR